MADTKVLWQKFPMNVRVTTTTLKKALVVIIITQKRDCANRQFMDIGAVYSRDFHYEKNSGSNCIDKVAVS